jgi:type I restriction enzyme M protein
MAKPAQGSGLNGLLDDPNQLAPNLNLGNKRRRIGDPSDKEKDPDYIGELTKIFGNCKDGQTRTFTEEDPVTHQSVQRRRVISKIFDNEDFGYHKITVERPLRLNFQASAERISGLNNESGFKNLAASNKKDLAAREKEITTGKQRQEEIRELLRTFGKVSEEKLYKDRKEFLAELRKLDRERDVRLSAPELKAVLAALGERDETAEICRDRDGQPEPDTDLRDTETVPLKESIDEYFKREVLPHVPDAWIDHSKTKVGYEIPLNRHFYRYEPPRPLEVIETDIKKLEGEILDLLKEVTA